MKITKNSQITPFKEEKNNGLLMFQSGALDDTPKKIPQSPVLNDMLKLWLGRKKWMMLKLHVYEKTNKEEFGSV